MTARLPAPRVSAAAHDQADQWLLRDLARMLAVLTPLSSHDEKVAAVRCMNSRHLHALPGEQT